MYVCPDLTFVNLPPSHLWLSGCVDADCHGIDRRQECTWPCNSPEERVEGVVRIKSLAIGVLWLLAIRLDAVLEAEELPACVTNLATALTKVNEEDFAHGL